LYYAVDEKSHESDLTELGRAFLNPDDPDAFVLPDIATAFAEIDIDPSLERRCQAAEAPGSAGAPGPPGAEDSQHHRSCLRAYCLYEKDVHYVVEENKVVIVDEHTGRKMAGRRWSDGLHGAVEAKEGVQIDAETQTLATITDSELLPPVSEAGRHDRHR